MIVNTTPQSSTFTALFYAVDLPVIIPLQTTQEDIDSTTVKTAVETTTPTAVKETAAEASTTMVEATESHSTVEDPIVQTTEAVVIKSCTVSYEDTKFYN